jgi:uncharacterized protein
MKSHPEFAADLTGFNGTVPIFPLPESVLFPHVAMPLHIFEPRYRCMISDALEDDRLVALALLKPGWEPYYEESPPIHEMVCLGRITAEEKLESGKYNLVLTGLHRAVVVEERQTDLPYRVGRLELYRDFYSREPLVNHRDRSDEMLSAFRRLFPKCQTDALWSQILEADLPLGVLSDLLASVLRASASWKLSVLEELDVDLRSDLVLDRLRERLLRSGMHKTPRAFPPEFSLN